MWHRLRELPTGYKIWHLVPLLMPFGFLLIFLGASGPHDWLTPAGFGLLAIVVIDLIAVFPLVMVRAIRNGVGKTDERRDKGPSA